MNKKNHILLYYFGLMLISMSLIKLTYDAIKIHALQKHYAILKKAGYK